MWKNEGIRLKDRLQTKRQRFSSVQKKTKPRDNGSLSVDCKRLANPGASSDPCFTTETSKTFGVGNFYERQRPPLPSLGMREAKKKKKIDHTSGLKSKAKGSEGKVEKIEWTGGQKKRRKGQARGKQSEDRAHMCTRDTSRR